MTQQQQRQVLPLLLFLLLLIGLLLHETLAWVPMNPSCTSCCRQYHPTMLVGGLTTTTTRWMAADESSSDNVANAKQGHDDVAASIPEEEKDELNISEDSTLVSTPSASTPESPEITAMKEEIAKLEEQLKGKHRELLTVKDLAEEYSKVGYARKVAEMENMRRFRSQLQSSNEFTATANVVSEFLPVLDELQRLKSLYQDDAFGKSYNALAGNFQTALLELGVEEYAIPIGSPVDTRRIVIVDTEYSDQFAKNTVIKPVRVGLELKGNVVRLAECVASLGSQAEAAAAAEEETKASTDEAAAAVDTTPVDDTESA